MRNLLPGSNDSDPIAVAVQEHLKDLDRYYRHKGGSSFADIATEDRISPDAVKISVRKGRNMYDGEQLLIYRDLKQESAIASERIRAKVRERVETQVVDAVETLLTGKRTYYSVDKATGIPIVTDVVDPDVISAGLEHARKIISLDEKPAQNQTYVNIQNNQQNINEGGASTALSYEERLKKIRNAQTRMITAPREESIIDAEVSPVYETAIPAAAETELDAGAPGDWQF